MTTERDITRRYLVPVRSDPAPGAAEEAHLAVLSWNGRIEAWLTGMAICGEICRQGEIAADTSVTCAKCVVMQPRYEQMLTGDPKELLQAYVRVFKQLPRQAAAELPALMARDPQITPSSAAVQAAILTSVAHRLGWSDNSTREA